MGQCRTLDADVTIGYYYSDYSSCDNTIPTSLFIWNKFFPSHLYTSFYWRASEASETLSGVYKFELMRYVYIYIYDIGA